MTPELLIVGSGIMGAAVAAEVRRLRPHTRITMVEAGPLLGTVPAQHLHDVAEESERASYNANVAAGVQSMYVGAATAGHFSDRASAAPGLYAFGALGHRSDAMPAAASAWNVGGMGSRWTAACPTPWGSEIPTFISPAEWADDYDRTRRLLRVTTDRFGPTPAGSAVIDALTDAFGAVSAPGRGPQIMPMAVSGSSAGGLRRTDPGRIFPEIVAGSELFELIPDALARRILVDGDRARGVEIADPTGATRVVEASAVVVCADALRSPQLLFASGIRPPALGRYLNEHAFLTGRVFAEPGTLGVGGVPIPRPGEWMSDSLWLPHSGSAQPFHWQVSVGPLYSDDLTDAVAMAVSISVYVPTTVRAESRIEFSDTETDAAGMPLAHIVYEYTDEDLALIERAREQQQRAFEAVGGADALADTLLLPPGSSLHYSGTVRMGAADDGTSVTDPEGRVWGVQGLYAAGNGVLPTAVVANVTPAGTVTAVRAGRSVAAALGE
ncbi:GMC oxidoreductase [Microbacterium sp. 18062]|uniref:GMC oxidoreductase n=1 Tax=Microbacterium sp. 18062 TaxID=2681410 RepID=UPI001359C149|nr:GMC oxidoreductase [Microbacterium sp. 18062]